MRLRISSDDDFVILTDEVSGLRKRYEKGSYYPKNNNDGTLSIVASINQFAIINSLPAEQWLQFNGDPISTDPNPLTRGVAVYFALSLAFAPAAAPTPFKFDFLNDVDETGKLDGEVFTWDSASSTYKPEPRIKPTDFVSSTISFTGNVNGPITAEVTGGTSPWTPVIGGISYNTGNVGIGTTSPSEKLHVAGNIKPNLSSGSIVLGNSSANATALDIDGYFTSQGAIKVYNNNDRGFTTNINTQGNGFQSIYNGTSQSSSYDVAYYLAAGAIDNTNGTTDLTGFKFIPSFRSETGTTVKAFRSNLSSASNRYNLYLDGDAQNYIAGNVGIGTTSPNAKLDVAGDTNAEIILGRARFRSFVDDYLFLSHFDRSSSTDYALKQSPYGSTALNAASGQNVSLNISNSPVLSIIGATGNVGIGTNTPAAKLDISDSNSNIAVFRTTNANADLYLRASGTGSDGKVGIRASDNNLRFISNGATQASFNGSNLGIGTTTPSERLDVSGNIFMSEGSKLMSEATDPTSGAQPQSLEFFLPYRSDGITMAENRSALMLGGHKFFEPRTTNNSTLHVFNGLSIAPTNSVNKGGYLSIGFGDASDTYPSTAVSLGSWANFAQTNDRHFKNYGYFGVRFEANGARYDVDGASLGEFNTTGLGIGTNSPSEKLHVVGNVVVDSGNSNMFIGDSTTGDSITGEKNIAIGESAMRSASATSQYGIAIGSEAARYGGHDHGMSIGFSAGHNGASGSAYVGSSAGKMAAGQRNVGIGYASGGGFSNGVQNLFGNVSIGYAAGSVLETAATAVGYQALTALTTGTGNTAVGYQAGDSVLAGVDNTFLGYGTDLVNGNNSYNTLIGSGAYVSSNGNRMTAVGYSARAGGSSTSIGAQAGNNNSGESVAMGYQAGNGAGNWNTSIGNSAHTLSTGNYNTSIGGGANRFTSGDNNVAVGNAAAYGVQNTSTFSNTVAVGYQALTSLTTGGQNTAVGYQASSVLTTQSNVTAIGYQAGQNATTANNVYIGTNAGKNYNTGDQAVIIGYNAGYVNANGQHNVFIGGNTGAQAAGSERNVAVGMSAGYFLGGVENVLLGGYAGQGSGASNFSKTVAVGHQALNVLTTGAENTAVGYQAGASLTTGGSNTLVGYQAGTAITGSLNAILGNNSGTSLTSGSGNVFVGSSAGNSVTTRGNNVAIGKGADVGVDTDYGVAIGGFAKASGGYTTAFGYFAGNGSSGVWNVLNGFNTMRNSSGSYNAVSGGRSMYATGGSYNAVMGQGAMDGGGSNHNYNVVIGYNAFQNGSNNVIIGANAASASGTLTNKLYIENSNSSSPLIYGEFDNDILRVNGTLQVGDPTSTGFAFPSTDGTANQVLSTDGAGTVSWVNQSGGGAATGAEIGFAYKTTDQTLTGTFTAISAFDGEFFDELTAFDPTTGALTITDVGHYLINVDVMSNVTSGISRSGSEIYLEFNGNEVAGSRRGMYNRSSASGYTSASITFPYYHSTGTGTFKVMAAQTSGTDTVIIDNCTFSYSTLGGTQGPQGVSGDAFDVSTEAAGRTLVAGDHLKYLRSTSATAVTFTVPPQSSASWVDNAEIVFEQAGAGQITIAAGSGVTINSSETLKSGQQYAVIGLKRVASDTWTLTGERESA